MKALKTTLICLAALALSACTTLNHSGQYQLPANSKLGVMPLVNHTETPLAGKRATDVLTGVLRSRGFTQIVQHRPVGRKQARVILTTKRYSKQQVLAWAQQRHLNAVFTGSVTEWRYKVGLDGEPVVGLNLTLISVPGGRVLWSAVGSKIGHSRQALAAVGQKLTRKMLSSLSRNS